MAKTKKSKKLPNIKPVAIPKAKKEMVTKPIEMPKAEAPVRSSKLKPRKPKRELRPLPPTYNEMQAKNSLV
jgi:hypothetical protein